MEQNCGSDQIELEGTYPLVELAEKRLLKIKRVLLVASGKGGVGKSLIAASIALKFAERGYRVGLLDLDLHGPTSHAVLGARADLESSREGLEPIVARGVKLMSVAFFVGNSPLPLRGETKRDLVVELLGVTNWGELDLLVIDLPPGTGDEVLAILRVLGERCRALVVTTPSALSLGVVRRLLELFKDEGVEVLGVVENMAYLSVGGQLVEPFGSSRSEELGVKLLGRIPLDPGVERALSKGLPPTSSPAFSESLDELCNRLERALELLGQRSF